MDSSPVSFFAKRLLIEQLLFHAAAPIVQSLVIETMFDLSTGCIHHRWGARYHTCRQDFPTVMALSKYKVAPLLLGKTTEIFRGMRALLYAEEVEDPRYAQLSMDDCLDFFGAPTDRSPCTNWPTTRCGWTGWKTSSSKNTISRRTGPAAE
ncbi:MAG: hypothetical protein GY696_28360, partial [Gammaproteobacteria bacterium]|nr:hypothetical protein [Gammaproteobacteria bacterium]